MNFIISDDALFSFSNSPGVDWTPVLIEVCPQKLYKAWISIHNGRYFLQDLKKDNGHIDRMKSAKWRVANKDELWAPVVDLKVEDPLRFYFAAGRHTFMALVEAGYKSIKVTVPCGRAKILSDAYAPD